MNSFTRTFGFINQHPLAKKHLFKSYLKFFHWQIKCRLNTRLQPVKFINTTYFLAKKGATGVTGNIYTGLHEFNDMGFLLHFLRAEDLFFDVGANVGSYTLLASGVCRAKSIAFEPAPSTFDILQQNIALNKIENLVKTENKGVGKEHGKLKFSLDEDTTNHILADNELHNHFIEVPIVPLTDYLSFGIPSLIKIDVEGFETEVLNGANLILQNPTLKAIIIELIGSGERYGYDEQKVHEKLLALSFKPYRYNPLSRTLEEVEAVCELNTIYLRDFDFVNARLKSAKPFEVFNENI